MTHGARRENGSKGMFLATVNRHVNSRRAFSKAGWNSTVGFNLFPTVERPYDKYHPIRNGIRMNKSRL